jgi:murein L,D-transpeptidase YafK
VRRPLLVLLPVAALALAVTVPAPVESAPATCKRPEVVVRKAAGTVELLCAGQVRSTFAATFGAQPVGPKEREGDEKTPEGSYRIVSKLQTPRFHRFLAIDYPNADDRRRARARGIQRPGSGIGLHGVERRLAPAARAWTRIAHATGLHRLWGPTDGCVGLTNEDVDALWAAVPVGTKVLIEP